MGLCFSCCDGLDINPEKVDLSHFTLHRVLGRGGFGKVQVVESRLNGDMYAMKSMSKLWLCQSASNVKSVWLERHIMVQLRSNFLVHTYYAFQDENHIYLVMQFLPGGDLHFLLHQKHMFSLNSRDTTQIEPLPEDSARFYLAEILLGLEEMHSVGLVYRDLKPENVLLDAEGHVKLSDFGLAGDLNSESDGMTIGACGTSGYMSQELLANMKYDFTPDVYAFGVTMYELLHGHLPQQNYEDPSTLFFRKDLSPECISLLVALLQHDPAHRIGCDTHRHDRWQEVKDHPWFASIDWEIAVRKGLTPPFKPEKDIANCDPMFELEEQLIETHLAPEEEILVTPEQQAIFKGWDWHTEPQYHTKESNLLPSSASFTAPISSPHDSSSPKEDVELMPEHRHERNHTSSSFEDFLPITASSSGGVSSSPPPILKASTLDDQPPGPRDQSMSPPVSQFPLDEFSHHRSVPNGTIATAVSSKSSKRHPHQSRSDESYKVGHIPAAASLAPVSHSTPLRTHQATSSMDMDANELEAIQLDVREESDEEEHAF